jgi:hypothetical protein
MNKEKQASDLQLEPDLTHERREWRVQRVGWVLLALLCGAALAGLLGPGPLSNKQAGKIGSELYIEYDRYIRHEAPYTIKVYCRPEPADEFTLSLDRAFIENAEIKQIQPEPKETTAAGDKYLFHFNAKEASDQLVTFHFEPDTFGEISSAVTLNEKHSQKVKQFVWP